MTILSERNYTARIDHPCDYCFNQIIVGNIYTRSVIAMGGGRLMTLKEHLHPPCPEDPFKDWDRDKDYDNLEGIINEVILDKAA